MRLARVLIALIATSAIAKGPLVHHHQQLFLVAPDRVPSIIRKIAKMEGFYATWTLPHRMNNPGALEFRGQPNAVVGEIAADGEVLAKFSSQEAGFAALEKSVRSKLARHIPLTRGWPYLGPNGE